MRRKTAFFRRNDYFHDESYEQWHNSAKHRSTNDGWGLTGRDTPQSCRQRETFARVEGRVAIFLIVFDIELAFTIPRTVAIRDAGWPGFLAMRCFLFVLAAGFAYEWGKGKDGSQN
ncbi:NADH-quinone oxidoreductase subunit A [Pandoraea communis]|uniref:NADH-quinone oxidoreductase subunit A n=1 Tax=Pandoraea communis TaxID=2508297 RepID=UPI001241355C|nr:NADH-quinone oxidoreductase subunit A [Pandoraea communis]